MNEYNRQKSGSLILCGGRSSRMKTDKAKLLLHEETFLDIICAKLRHMDGPHYISLTDHEEEIPEGFIVLKDEAKDETGSFIGPLGGIDTGLKECLRDGLEGIYTVPVDMPLFETELFDLINEAIKKDPEADIYVPLSSDGRIHPASGYYRTSALNAVQQLIHARDYRMMSLIRHPDLRTVYVNTMSAEQDRMLFNVNTPADYRSLLQSPEHRTKHIVIQGERGSGKSTLIRNLVKEMQWDAGGFLSRAVMNQEKGYREIYMVPASFLFSSENPDDTVRKNGRLCGTAMNRVIETYPEVFDSYGTELIHAASKKQLIIMDEIGLMEEKAQKFQKAVLSAFDGNIPVLAAVKMKTKTSPFLEAVRIHENVRLIDLSETNRDEIHEQLRKLYLNNKEDPQ